MSLDELKKTRQLIQNTFALLFQHTEVKGQQVNALADSLKWIDELYKQVQADIEKLEPKPEAKAEDAVVTDGTGK